MNVEGRTAIKACTTINVPFEKVAPLFNDHQFMRGFQENLIKVEVPYKSGNIQVLHSIVGMPGPVSNR